MQAILGIAVLLGLAWLLSENRRGLDWRMLITALAMQFALAAVLLKAPVLSEMLLAVNGLVRAVEQATQAGTGFVFGYLGGGPEPRTAGRVSDRGGEPVRPARRVRRSPFLR